MSAIIISGDSSGTITLDAPAVAGTNTLTLPAATGTVALTTDAIVKKHLITSSSNVTLNSATINGTTGQSGQSNIGSTFTMIIPANGIIRLDGISLKLTNDATASAHNITFGIRISTTNYWFGFRETNAPGYSYVDYVTGGTTANRVTDVYGGEFFGCIDVVGAGLPTGSQTVQLIAASTSGTTGVTINGATRQTRVTLTVTT